MAGGVGVAGTTVEEEGSAAPDAGEAVGGGPEQKLVGAAVTRLAVGPKGWALDPRRARRVTAEMVVEGSAAVDG